MENNPIDKNPKLGSIVREKFPHIQFLNLHKLSAIGNIASEETSNKNMLSNQVSNVSLSQTAQQSNEPALFNPPT